ncbi:MAG TPA: RluA family pseudouridine synthase [Candidatus Cryptobacteroides excrementigallinarum]|nr:RluA family pseudouridine synthase [Candidatus Cryptobacteroides excrementigallinarum]
MFTYPFRYAPSPETVEAAKALAARIDASPRLRSIFSEGKMLGVLLTDRGVLNAFSGLAGGLSVLEDFVPPIFDYGVPDGYFRRREAEISAMPDGIAKGRESARLQDWLFDQYKVLNANGEQLSVKRIFARRGLVPPGGTGDCAAPKLLQYAYLHGMKPLAMGEFWYGTSHSSEVRVHGHFYPACFGKCGPLLSFMMEGLDVEPNPLDREYEGREPAVLHADNSIIVVDKPAGMLSVPGRNGVGSLLDWLAERYGEVHSCHRLDMDTSGIMVYARNIPCKAALEAQFAGREVSKTYRARLSAGSSPFRRSASGTIALPLSPDYYDRPRQIVDMSSGKPAISEYKVLEMLPDGEIDILFHPLTGRTHQLRVHAAHPSGLGRPIKGDLLYGGTPADRLYLHAESLSFAHPASGVKLTFRTE